MKVQISNFILTFLDISDWIDFALARLKYWLLALYVRVLALLAYRAAEPAAALCSWHVGDVQVYKNATIQMEAYYRFDKTQSVASAHRWLSRFYPNVESLHLVYHRGSGVEVSHVDLLTDVELLTGAEIPDADMDLHTLPAISLDSLFEISDEEASAECTDSDY